MIMGIVATFIAIAHAVIGSELRLENSIVSPCLDIPLSQELLAVRCVEPVQESESQTSRWTFSHQSGECEEYPVRSICAQNANERFETTNIFDSKAKCQDSCVYARCFLSPLASQCQIQAQYWFYSTVNGTCLPYPVGSCPSSINSFADEIDCYAFCAKALCVVGMKHKPCAQDKGEKGTYKRWFLNFDQGRCEQFSYQICDDPSLEQTADLNNFLNEQECVDLCHCDEKKLPGIKCHPRLRHIRMSTDLDIVPEPESTTNAPVPDSSTSLTSVAESSPRPISSTQTPSTEAPTSQTETPIIEKTFSVSTNNFDLMSTVAPQKHTDKIISRDYVDPKLDFEPRTLHIEPRADFEHLVTDMVKEKVKAKMAAADRRPNGGDRPNNMHFWVYLVVLCVFLR